MERVHVRIGEMNRIISSGIHDEPILGVNEPYDDNAPA